MSKKLLALTAVGLTVAVTPILSIVDIAGAGTYGYTAITGPSLLTMDLNNTPVDFITPLPKYNPTMYGFEKLEQVDITFKGEMLSRNLAIINISTDSITIPEYTEEANMSVSSSIPFLNINSTDFSGLKITENNIVVPSLNIVSFSDLSATDTISLTFDQPGQLNAFIGSGNVDLLVNTALFTNLPKNDFSGTDLLITGNTLAGLEATITYRTIGRLTTDPEPSTVVALGVLGLGMSGFLKKRG